MKGSHWILAIGFLTILFCLFISSFMLPDRASSWWENRSLAQVPTISWKGLETGVYFKEVERYVTDQFPWRDQWMAAYTKLQLLRGKTFVNDTYVTPDGMMLKKPLGKAPDEQLTRTAHALNELGSSLKDQHIPFYYALMPAKVNTLSMLLPANVPHGFGQENREQVIRQLDSTSVQFIDVGKLLNEAYPAKEIPSLYFKTDHHWNMEGAMFGYQTVISALSADNPAIRKEDAHAGSYRLRCEQRTFMGSWNKQLTGQVKNHGDQPCYYDPLPYRNEDFLLYKGPIETKNLIPFDSFYATGLHNPNLTLDYGLAYAHDLREINIVNPQSPNNLRVLVIKDSYTNPILFMLAHHFQTTTFYDIRFNRDRSVMDFIKQNKFDLVMVLYNDEVFTDPMYIFDRTPAE